MSAIPRILALALLAAAFACVWPEAATAGFLDVLFGAPPAPPPPAAEPVRPLEMTVRPPKPAARAKAEAEHKAERMTPIDPVAHPHWYLEDPTLRHGDIVVLPRGAMVYQGRAAARRLSDFEEVARSRLLSRRERERIQQITEFRRALPTAVARPEIRPQPAEQPSLMPVVAIRRPAAGSGSPSPTTAGRIQQPAAGTVVAGCAPGLPDCLTWR